MYVCNIHIIGIIYVSTYVPAVYQCQLQQADRFQDWEGRGPSQPAQTPQGRGGWRQEGLEG